MAGADRFAFSRFSEKRSYQSSDVAGYDDYVEGVEPEETASLDVPIAKENLGFKLIEKMGWQSGTGLGRNKQGRVEPIPFELKDDYLGLGRWSLELELAQDATEKRKQLEAEKELTPYLIEKYKAQAQKDMEMAETIFEMRKSFYCELCDKQYTKYSEWDNHINSYSHHHNQRLQGLREYETGRKFGGHRNLEEEREKMMAAQLVAIERARMTAKRAHSGFSPAFKPIGQSSTDQNTGYSSWHQTNAPSSSQGSTTLEVKPSPGDSQKVAEKKARLAKYGLRFQSAGTLVSVRDGGHKIVSKEKGTSSPAGVSEEGKCSREGVGDTAISHGEAMRASSSSGGKRFKSWIQGETLEPDVGGEVHQPLSETRKMKRTDRDDVSVEDSDQFPRKLPKGFSRTSFLPAGYQPKPIAIPEPSTISGGPPPLLGRNKQLAKAFAEEDEEETLTLTRLPVKRLTKFKFNIKK